MNDLLIIEDDPDIVALYRRMLQGSTLRITGVANDGQAGLGHAERAPPDVVLLDLSMPEADGLEVLVGLKRVAPAARVVVVSGFHPDQLEPITNELGAYAYLQKGVPPLDLVAALEQAASAEAKAFHAPSSERVAALVSRARELI